MEKEEKLSIQDEVKLKEYKSLIKEFEELPQLPKRLPTFMELSGYPHYENVCSNILRFYFNTSEPHGLDNLLLKSLLECLDKNELAQNAINTTDVYREESTESKRRIDLVIESDDLIIAIENKIFHWLHNDLADYSNHIHEKAKKFQHKLFVVLSIRQENNMSGGFVNVTYEELFRCVKKNIGNYLINGNNRYITYLIDFIESIENLVKPQPMNLEMLNFIASNEEKILELQTEYKDWMNKLNGVLYQVNDKIPSKGENVHKWIWNKYVLVHDFIFGENVNVAVDCAIDFRKVSIEVFVRSGRVDKQEYLTKLNLFATGSQIYKKSDRGYLVYEKEQPFYEINPEELAKQLNGILDKIKMEGN